MFLIIYFLQLVCVFAMVVSIVVLRVLLMANTTAGAILCGCVTFIQIEVANQVLIHFSLYQLCCSLDFLLIVLYSSCNEDDRMG